MTWTETLRFVFVGVAVFAVSLVVFGLAIPTTGAAVATLIRLAVVFPLLYLGYSRYVLRELLVAEQRKSGWRRAELQMAARIAASIGASIGAKLLLEPPISFLLETYSGQDAAFLSPVLADFGYGPLANYLVLYVGTRNVSRE